MIKSNTIPFVNFLQKEAKGAVFTSPLKIKTVKGEFELKPVNTGFLALKYAPVVGAMGLFFGAFDLVHPLAPSLAALAVLVGALFQDQNKRVAVSFSLLALALFAVFSFSIFLSPLFIIFVFSNNGLSPLKHRLNRPDKHRFGVCWKVRITHF